MTLPVVFTANGAQGYNLTKSLRFRSSASAYLNRTPASASNRKTWTYSCWAKMGSGTGIWSILSCPAANNDNQYLTLYWNQSGSTGKLYFGVYTGNYRVSTPLYRDPAGWYHFVFVLDTTQATADNRIKIYVNGTEVTAFSTLSNPSLNADLAINQASATYIGTEDTNLNFLDGYLAEVNFIDGQALTPSSFGETSASTGVWQPIKYAGTYGTNGFYLPFTDTTSTTTISEDFSGNNNDWTSNNISLTAGSTYDSMKDVPTLTDTDTANYWTLNPLNPGQLGTPQSGNLEWIAGDQNNFRTIAAPILPTSGKFYWEVTPIGGGSGGAFVSGIYIGIMDYANGGTGLFASGARIADTGKDDFVYYSDGRKVNLNSFVSYGNSYSANDVVGIAVDIDNGKIWFSKNGTWQASGDPAAGTNAAYTTVPFSTKTYAPAMSAAEITNAQKFNFGQRPFAYTPPTGFKALNTFNLPTPTIGATASSQANKYMDISLYTGTGSSQSITGLNFQPDWTWIKGRSGATDHGLYDAVRGVQKQLESNNTDAETTETTGLTAFNSNGFTVGALAQLNTSSATYVGWNWKANGSGSSNTDGSITSTVSANTTAGFSIVSYTGNQSAGATVGHGLGVAPSMVIIKCRGAVTSWSVYHVSLGATKWILLNSANAATTSNQEFNDTAPTSSVFSIGNSSSNSNQASTYVAYCFAAVAGYSAFGSYTGNGSTDGPFVFTGFRPRFILIKRSDAGAVNWYIFDTARDTYNAAGLELYPNLSNAEVDGRPDLDILSNGFKIRSTSGGQNTSSGTYIYACFAEFPFRYSLAR